MGLFTSKQENQEVTEAQSENNAIYLGACAILGGLLASSRYSGMGTDRLVSIAVADAEKVMEALFDEAVEDTEPEQSS